MSGPTPGRVAKGVVFGVLITSAPAAAADADEVAGMLSALMTSATRNASYDDAVQADDGTVTITGFALADEPNHISIDIGSIVVRNPIDRPEGGFTAEAIELVDGTVTDESNTLRWDVVTLTDTVVTDTVEVETEDSEAVLPLSGLTAEGVVLEPPQANPLTVERVELSLGDEADGVPYSIAVALTGIVAPTGIVDNSLPVSTLDQMGFDTLVIDLDLAGSFDAETDMLSADQVGITIRDFGRLEIGGILADVPLSLLAEPGGPNALLASAQLVEVRIRFENDGAVEAFLAEQGRQMDMNAEDVAFGLATAFRLYLRTLEDPELEAQVGSAVVEFLEDPRSITLTALPEESVPLAEVIALLISAPTVIPSLLGVEVVANN